MPQRKKPKEKSCERWLLLTLSTIAIIMLVCIALAAFGVDLRPKWTHNKARAEHTVSKLARSIRTFFTEYSRHPISKSADKSETIQYSNEKLMPILIGTESSDADKVLNPRKIPFYYSNEVNGKRGGLCLDPNGIYELFDPWGNHYRAIIDTNGDDQITPPKWTGLKDPIPKNVIVWSPGKDGKDETAKDNITSW